MITIIIGQVILFVGVIVLILAAISGFVSNVNTSEYEYGIKEPKITIDEELGPIHIRVKVYAFDRADNGNHFEPPSEFVVTDYEVFFIDHKTGEEVLVPPIVDEMLSNDNDWFENICDECQYRFEEVDRLLEKEIDRQLEKDELEFKSALRDEQEDKYEYMQKWYPRQICAECAQAAGGKMAEGHICSWYSVRCDVCGEKKPCTEPSDFGYPSVVLLIKRKEEIEESRQIDEQDKSSKE